MATKLRCKGKLRWFQECSFSAAQGSGYTHISLCLPKIKAPTLLSIEGIGQGSLSASSVCRDKMYLWVTETLQVWDVLVAFTASFTQQTTGLLDYLCRRGSQSL